MVKVIICMLFNFSTPVLTRHMWQLKTSVFLHWCLIHAVLLNWNDKFWFKFQVHGVQGTDGKPPHSLRVKILQFNLWNLHFCRCVFINISWILKKVLKTIRYEFCEIFFPGFSDKNIKIAYIMLMLWKKDEKKSFFWSFVNAHP